MNLIPTNLKKMVRFLNTETSLYLDIFWSKLMLWRGVIWEESWNLHTIISSQEYRWYHFLYNMVTVAKSSWSIIKIYLIQLIVFGDWNRLVGASWMIIRKKIDARFCGSFCWNPVNKKNFLSIFCLIFSDQTDLNLSLFFI